MQYTDEDIAAFAALGINPDTLPLFLASEPAPLASKDRINDLSDAEYAILRQHLPPEPHSDGSKSNKNVLDALLWCQVNGGKKMTQIPARYATSEAIRKRAERWCTLGTWDRMLAALDNMDLSETRRSDLRKLAVEQIRRGDRIRAYRAGEYR